MRNTNSRLRKYLPKVTKKHNEDKGVSKNEIEYPASMFVMMAKSVFEGVYNEGYF